MDIQERVISGILGVIWGAVLGLLIALALSYFVGASYSRGFLIADWRSTIIGSAVLCGLGGLVFKTSVATAIGTMMTWVFNAITHNNEGGVLDHFPTWMKLAALLLIGYVFYLYVRD